MEHLTAHGAVQKTLRSGVSLAMTLATAINGFLALMVARFAWQLAHDQADRFDGLDIAMYVFVLSVPMAALCLFGVLISFVLRLAVPGTYGAQFHPRLAALAAVNILAPIVLWHFLRWAAS